MRYAALLALLLAPTAMAGEPASEWSEYGVARTRLIAGESDGETLRAAVQIALEPGWKTYWKAPGDAGIPPSFDWSGSTNVADIVIGWPRPSKFESFGYTTWGYDDGVVLPLSVTAENPDEPVFLSMEAFYGVCSDLCAPVQGSASLGLTEATPETEALIAEAEASMPRPGAAAGLSLEDVQVEGEGEDRVILARIIGEFTPENVLIAGPEDAALGEPEVQAEADGMSLRIPTTLYADDALDGADLSFTLLGALRAAELTTTLGACSVTQAATC